MPRHQTLRLCLLQSRRALFTWAVIAALLVLTLPASATDAPQRVDLGGRHYLIQLPDIPQGAPILLALHGGGGNPAQFARASGLGDDAAAAGYAVVFPAGTGRRGDAGLLTWNGGYCCGPAARGGVDDAAFLRAVIADAAGRYGLDADRVFITGMSNGAIMAETFAATQPGAVRAVAGVAGTMDAARLTVAGPVPALIIHGTADTMVPYAGGQGDTSLTRTDFAPVAAVVKAFLQAQPGTLARTERIVDDLPDDGTSVRITDWTRKGRAMVRLITIEGGAHHWPGGRKARLSAGKTREISANDQAIAFFNQFR